MPCDNELNEKISNLIDKYGFQSVLESVSNKGEAESSIAEGEDRKDAALKLYFLAKQVRYLSEEFSNEKI